MTTEHPLPNFTIDLTGTVTVPLARMQLPRPPGTPS